MKSSSQRCFKLMLLGARNFLYDGNLQRLLVICTLYKISAPVHSMCLCSFTILLQANVSSFILFQLISRILSFLQPFVSTIFVGHLGNAELAGYALASAVMYIDSNYSYSWG